jgi:hypothetical protein
MHRWPRTELSLGEVALALIGLIAAVNVGFVLVILALWLRDRHDAAVAARRNAPHDASSGGLITHRVRNGVRQ